MKSFLNFLITGFIWSKVHEYAANHICFWSEIPGPENRNYSVRHRVWLFARCSQQESAQRQQVWPQQPSKFVSGYSLVVSVPTETKLHHRYFEETQSLNVISTVEITISGHRWLALGGWRARVGWRRCLLRRRVYDNEFARPGFAPRSDGTTNDINCESWFGQHAELTMYRSCGYKSHRRKIRRRRGDENTPGQSSTFALWFDSVAQRQQESGMGSDDLGSYIEGCLRKFWWKK